ncbi:hypothetical protein STENM327S_02330 [Streptomyces tendae]
MAAPGGTSQANLRIRWRTEKLSGSTWSVAHTDLDGPTSGYVGSGAAQTGGCPRSPRACSTGLKALTLSYDEAGDNPSRNTGYTSPCYFTVDQSRKSPVITPASGSPYTLCTAVCLPGGGPGVKGKFTFAPASGDTNVAYQYRQANKGTWSAEIKGSTVSVDITPPATGHLPVGGPGQGHGRPGGPRRSSASSSRRARAPSAAGGSTRRAAPPSTPRPPSPRTRRTRPSTAAPSATGWDDAANSATAPTARPSPPRGPTPVSG